MDPDYCKEGKEGPWTQSKSTSRTIILSGKDEQSSTQAETRAQISKGEISALVCLTLLAEAENMEWW